MGMQVANRSQWGTKSIMTQYLPLRHLSRSQMSKADVGTGVLKNWKLHHPLWKSQHKKQFQKLLWKRAAGVGRHRFNGVTKERIVQSLVRLELLTCLEIQFSGCPACIVSKS